VGDKDGNVVVRCDNSD